MILIIGGAFQGKREYAETNYENAGEHIFYLNTWARGRFEKAEKDGAVLQDKMSEDTRQALKNKIADDPGLIIITDEIGRGIVPAQRRERDFREFVGGLQVMLAQEADEVVRVICGIGQRIK